MESSVSKSSCRNFRANLWRPHTCTNCYKSKTLHQLQQPPEPTTKGILSTFKKLGPTKDSKKHLRQVASISALTNPVSKKEWSELGKSEGIDKTMPQRSLHTGPVVGVVKPYAVVDIDADCNEIEESSLDQGLKRRYSESNIQVNKVSLRTNNNNNKTKAPPPQPQNGSPSSNLKISKVKSPLRSSSNQSLDRLDNTGEANFLESIPKPALVIGKLLNEYHRSLSSTSLDGRGRQSDVTHDCSTSKRQGRGRSVEPAEMRRINAATVTRSSSLRQETTKSSKFRAINLLTRRKVSTPTEPKHLESIKHSSEPRKAPPAPSEVIFSGPKVTSPHPVRRNKASIYRRMLTKSYKHKNEMRVPARPRAMTVVATSNNSMQEPCLRQSSLKKRKRTPPEKPPRTLSTFFSSSEQEDLFRQLLENGSMNDVIKSEVNNDGWKTMVAPSKPSIHPPTSTPNHHTDVQPRVAPQPQGGNNVGNHTSHLPLGHTGDYAEVFSRSTSVPTSSSECGLSESLDSNYDSLLEVDHSCETSVSPSSPASASLFRLPATGSHVPHTNTESQPHTSTESQPHTSTESQPHTGSHVPQPHTNTESQPHMNTESQPHTSTESQPHTNTESQPHTSTPPPVENPYYSLPCTDLNNESQDDSPSSTAIPIVTPLQSPAQTKLNDPLTHLMSSTLERISQRELNKLICKDDLWSLTSWNDYQIISEREATYKGVTLSIKAIDTLSQDIQQNIKISKLLSPHPHLRLVRSLVNTHPTHPSPLTPSPHYLLTDHTTVDATTFLLSQRKALSSEDYLDLILLTLTQLFSALKYLYSNGVAHRDIGLECLFGRKVEGHWVVSLGEFGYALHREGPVNATTFVYGYHELEWLGGVDSRLPPEVIDTPENAQTVDYSHTDSFSAGCMIYELCSHGNPFEMDPELIFYQYTDRDFPKFSIESKRSQHLQKLANLLLKRDASKRVSTATALLICQSVQWLPKEWLKEPVSQTEVRSWLGMERGRLVCELAEREDRCVPLNTFLRGQFLMECDVSELIRALSLLTQSEQNVTS